MPATVLDSSALMALLLGEEGADRVEARMPGALVCAANLAEVVAKLAERGMPAREAQEAVAALGPEIVPLDEDLAVDAGALRAATRSAGLSLGDRCCLALARRVGGEAWTTDRAWAQVAAAAGVEVVLIRGGAP